MQFLDAETRAQLGFDEVWSRIAPVSAQGRAYHRKAKAFLPNQSADLEKEWDRVNQICARLCTDTKAASELNYLLGTLRDISAIINRSIEGLTLDDVEFYEVKKLLRTTEKIQAELERLGWETLLPTPLDLCVECKNALSKGQGQHDSFYLSDAYDENLTAIRKERFALECAWNTFRSSVESKVIEASGRILSMDDEITVSTSAASKIMQLETISDLGKVRETPEFVTFRLQEDETVSQVKRNLALARTWEEGCKQTIRERLTKIVQKSGERLLATVEQLGFLDLLLAKAIFCAEIGGVRPQLSAELCIQGGRHLLLEEELKQRDRAYTPLNIVLNQGVTLITGPNMGGKTASLKTIGLLTAMAQFGLLVPAISLTFTPLKFIVAHLTDAAIPKGLSAFAGEIAFLREAIKARGQNALILVDEIAHGTNPLEGACIAQAIMEKLQAAPAVIVITTHYPSLARVEGIKHLRVKGLDKNRLQRSWQELGQNKEEALHSFMDYDLEEGSLDQPFLSDAAVVAEAMGLDRDIIIRAKELLGRENNLG